MSGKQKSEPVLSRRVLLRAAGAGAAGLAAHCLGQPLAAEPTGPADPAGPGGGASATAPGAVAAPAAASTPFGGVTKLSDHLLVYHGAINVGIVADGEQALLIDCGDASVVSALAGAGVKSVRQVLFTHHHRDQACGAHLLAAGGAKIIVPAAERDHFDKVEAYWTNPKSRWHLYNLHPHHLMLAEPVAVDAALAVGQTMTWGPAKVTVLDTPGHTDGSVSYLVEVDGRRVLFCGDAICDEGKVWDIHSLQKGTQTTDYHGFLGTRPQLEAGLRRIRAAAAEALVPSHGRMMRDPARAINALVARLDACYDRYVAISALRHYFPKMFTEYAGRKDHMAIRPGKPVPACLRHFGTSWVLVSRDKAALVMDCGGPAVVEWLRKQLHEGELKAVEGLWVTHYHDDHVDGVEAFQKAFTVPCITDAHVAEVISDPPAWRLPCISPVRARVDRPTRDGESWRWREFQLTAFHLPGQTLYHAGLLVEGEGLRMLFAGDSFTAAGIDDYCTSNRNHLGGGVGFDRCIALIEKLQPTHIFNCHVKDAFDFTADECRFMRDNLAQREKLYGELVPWDHANYGMDEPWVRCQPYEQTAAAGAEVSLRVVITNHTASPRAVACRAVLPRSWSAGGATGAGIQATDAAGAPASVQATTDWAKAPIPPKSEGPVALSFRVPPGVKSGRYVIPVDVRDGRWTLPQFTEAIVVV